MPMRWEFRLFRLDSRPISAVLTRFKADFNRFGPFLLFWSPADTARFWLNQPNSTRIGVNRSRVNANPIKKKKKKARTQHRRTGNQVGRCVPCWAASNSGAVPSQPHPCFLGFLSLKHDLLLFYHALIPFFFKCQTIN